MPEYLPPTFSDSAIAEPRPALDYRRIEIVDPKMAEIYRSKTVTQRIQMMLDANATMRLLIAGALQTQNPDWSVEAINQEVAGRMLNGHHNSG
jgi:hypothetical protein